MHQIKQSHLFAIFATCPLLESFKKSDKILEKNRLSLHFLQLSSLDHFLMIANSVIFFFVLFLHNNYYPNFFQLLQSESITELF